MSPDPIAVPVATAAKMIGRERYVIYRAIANGSLPAYQPTPHNEKLIFVDDLKKWIRGEYADRVKEGAA